MTQIGKWPKKTITVFERGDGASRDAIWPAVRDVGLAARLYCVLRPLTKMTQIGKWAKNAMKFLKEGLGLLRCNWAGC